MAGGWMLPYIVELLYRGLNCCPFTYCEETFLWYERLLWGIIEAEVKSTPNLSIPLVVYEEHSFLMSIGTALFLQVLLLDSCVNPYSLVMLLLMDPTFSRSYLRFLLIFRFSIRPIRLAIVEWFSFAPAIIKELVELCLKFARSITLKSFFLLPTLDEVISIESTPFIMLIVLVTDYRILGDMLFITVLTLKVELLFSLESLLLFEIPCFSEPF